MAKLIKPADFATAILQLRGKPLSFDGYEPFIDIYNLYPQALILKAGRQLGKSVSLAGSLITNSILISNFNSLLITPLAAQTSRFSTSYLDPYMNSPLIRKHFVDRSSRKNVLLKQFNNQSDIFLGYAADEASADRIRGVNADQILCDEVQDISNDALPILFETLAASEYDYRRLTGTAKTENNTLEWWWNKSNKLEWGWKCLHCNKYIVPYDLDTCLKILQGKDGPMCPHCHKESHNVTEGKWISFNPRITNVYGFHLPQIIFGARLKKWADIRNKVDNYTLTKLSNEVLGLASGLGGRIVTMRECIACCNPNKTAFDEIWPVDDRAISMIVIGVDWSVTGSQKSFTVITVMGYDHLGKCYVLHSEKLSGVDILEQVDRVKYLFRKFDAQAIGSDRGVGVLQGQLLQREFGPERVFLINYVSAKRPLRWDGQGQFFAADRTQCIDTVVMKIKIGRTKIEAPAWSLMAPFFEDVLVVFEEESLAGKRLYRHDEDKPDDFLHSLVFGNIAQMVLAGEYVYVDDPPTQN